MTREALRGVGIAGSRSTILMWMSPKKRSRWRTRLDSDGPRPCRRVTSRFLSSRRPCGRSCEREASRSRPRCRRRRRPGFLLDDASESSSEAPSSTDDRIILTHYAVPDGFRAVKDSELGRPPALLGQSAVERGDLYLIICCDDGDWMMGRIAKHKPNAKSFQYDVAWSETSRVCQQGLRLEDLFDPDGDVALPGSWRYLRKVSERASPERSRYLRSPSQRNLAVFNKPVETIETPGGRIATVIEKRGRGWLFVELDGDANDEGGAFERKCIRQRASPTNDITRASVSEFTGAGWKCGDAASQKLTRLSSSPDKPFRALLGAVVALRRGPGWAPSRSALESARASR